MSLLDRLEVPAARSRASTRATLRPREAASRAAPAPVTPPPMTSTSNCSSRSRRRSVTRRIGESRPAAYRETEGSRTRPTLAPGCVTPVGESGVERMTRHRSVGSALVDSEFRISESTDDDVPALVSLCRGALDPPEEAAEAALRAARADRLQRPQAG